MAQCQVSVGVGVGKNVLDGRANCPFLAEVLS
jgi:hypothetical protein